MRTQNGGGTRAGAEESKAEVQPEGRGNGQQEGAPGPPALYSPAGVFSATIRTIKHRLFMSSSIDYLFLSVSSYDIMKYQMKGACFYDEHK